MSAHIKNVHGINISEDFSLEESDSALKKQKTLTGFIQIKSIEEEISRLASVDGLSFQCISKVHLFRKIYGRQNMTDLTNIA